MLTQIFGFILVYILFTFGSGYPASRSVFVVSYGVLIPLYAFVLGIIYWQGTLKHKSALLILSQIELIVFLIFLCLNLIDTPLPLVPFFLHTLLGFALYTVGIFTYYCGFYSTEKNSFPFAKAWSELRLTIAFAIAFVVLSLVSDLMILGDSLNLLASGWIRTGIEISIMVALIALISIGFPPLMTALWGCQELESSELKSRLELLCAQLKFRCRGILCWNAMQSTPTAAILGIFPRWRYIVLTPMLQRILSDESLEAVVVHEIGHSYYRHLCFYPFITGSVVIIGYALAKGLGLDLLASTSAYGFLGAVGLMFGWTYLYFRLVFGYFSRLFERQADLYTFKLGREPDGLIEGLLNVAFYCGQDPAKPCWHHYSIQERVDFLRRAKKEPGLVMGHDRKVWASLVAFLMVLAWALEVIP